MSASNKKTTDIIDTILKECNDIKRQNNENEKKISAVTELINIMNAMMHDISCKQDILLNTPKTKTNKVETDVKKPWPWSNVMGYFKYKYVISASAFDHIVSQEEAEELFSKHTTELTKNKKEKKDLNKCKANLIYKHIVKDSKNKMAMLRSMEEKEKSDNTKIKPEITENIIDDEETIDSEED